jgi:hypothetical protein
MKPNINKATTPPEVKTTTVEKLKTNDYFRLVGGKSVLVFKGYNRSTKKYQYCRWEDINHFGEKMKGTIVEIDFDF